MKINVTVDIPRLGAMTCAITSPFDVKTLVESFYAFDGDMKKIRDVMSDHAQNCFWIILLELYKKEHREELEKIREAYKLEVKPIE